MKGIANPLIFVHAVWHYQTQMQLDSESVEIKLESCTLVVHRVHTICNEVLNINFQMFTFLVLAKNVAIGLILPQYYLEW